MRSDSSGNWQTSFVGFFVTWVVPFMLLLGLAGRREGDVLIFLEEAFLLCLAVFRHPVCQLLVMLIPR